MKLGRSLNVLPPMQCDDGCGDCCGFVPVTQKQLDRVVRFAKENGITPVEQGERCPLYQGGRCSVYPVRPPICVAFGHSERLPCSRGYNTNVDERIIDRMMGSREEPFVGFLHDILGELLPPEMEEVLRALAPSVGMKR